MRTYLFEEGAGALEPLTLTRPTFALRCGMSTLAAKQLSHFCATAAAGLFVRSHLAEAMQLDYPGVPVNESIQSTSPLVLVNGRWLPPQEPAWSANEFTVGLVDDEVAWAVLGPEHCAGLSAENLNERLEELKQSLPCRPAGGRLVRYPWDLIENNAEQLCLDFVRCRSWPMENVEIMPAVVGPRDRLWLSASAHVDPMVVFDTRMGPVIVAEHAVITAFSRLEGPCYVGPHTHIAGASVRGSSFGPQCRIGGEVEASIIHGHSNKHHDGFLGHAYIGEWVNLGAGTCNSDLRNDYGPIQVPVQGEPTLTGLTKVGCFVGDHTKTGLVALLNTGTSIGIFCNILPAGRLAPKHMPSFTTWWNGSLRESADWTHLLTTARTMMQRRGQQLSDAQIAMYLHVFDETALERRRALRQAERPRHRHAA